MLYMRGLYLRCSRTCGGDVFEGASWIVSGRNFPSWWIRDEQCRPDNRADEDLAGAAEPV